MLHDGRGLECCEPSMGLCLVSLSSLLTNVARANVLKSDGSLLPSLLPPLAQATTGSEAPEHPNLQDCQSASVTLIGQA